MKQDSTGLNAQNLITAKAAQLAHEAATRNFPKQRLIMGISAGGTIGAAIIGLSSLYTNIRFEKERKSQQEMLPELQLQTKTLDSLLQTIQDMDNHQIYHVQIDSSKKIPVSVEKK